MTARRQPDGTLPPVSDSAAQVQSRRDVRAVDAAVDPLASERDSALWWALLGGGGVALALLVGPLLGLLRRRREEGA